MNKSPSKKNPFPGLRPFTQEEDYLFFGREEQTLELLERLGSHRFVAVVGTSGSGKSSLVRCGLLSELLGGKMLGAGAAWEIAVTHPGGNPLALLTEALLDADLYDREAENTRENLLATLSRSHFGLVEAVKQAGLGEETNFLLVVDQFEEIFRFNEAGQRQQEAANEFVSLLLEAVAQKDVAIYVVITMRSDFIGECGQFEGLAEMVNRGEFLIPRLTREQYKRVIEGPIKVAGGKIAPRLLQRLLNDLGQQADQLPCLQHALMRTWNVWAEKGDADELDLDAYQRVGKMSHALSLHADEIYDSLATDRQRHLCRGLFQALTVQESENRGIRRPQRLGRLCQILDVPIEELTPIIDAYRQHGVTFLMPSPEVELTDRTIVDISHESLMRVWDRLRRWVEEEAQAAGIFLRLSETAALYSQGKTGLYRDPELGIALAWRESQQPNAAWAERYHPGFDVAMAFLETSQQASVAEEQAKEAARQRELEQARQLAEAQHLRLVQQQRAAKKLHKLIGGLAVVAAIAGVACVAALVANHRANVQADMARQNEVRALENEGEAKENAKQAEHSQRETAMALALVARQKRAVEDSLGKAEIAERASRDAEEKGRQLLYTTDMRLAPFVWSDERTTEKQLRTLLEKHIPVRIPGDKNVNGAIDKSDLRGFEWNYYQYLLDHGATVFSGHGVPVVDGALPASGELVTLDQNGQVRRWDLESQDERDRNRRDLPRGGNAQVRIVSPDGRRAALAEGNRVRVHDTSTGQQAFQIASTNDRHRHLLFSRDGDWLIVADRAVRWVNGSGAVVATAAERFSRVESLACSADGLTLAVVGHGVAGRLISLFRLDPVARTVKTMAKDIDGRGTLTGAAMSPDGRLLAVGHTLSGSLNVLDVATGRSFVAHHSAHASSITSLAFSSDGAKLATAAAEGTIKIWSDPQKLSSKSVATLTLKGHQSIVKSVCFSVDGKKLASTSADNTARVWDLENAGAAIRQLERSARTFVARFSPDGQLIATATASSTVRLWDAATGRLVRELFFPGGSGRIESVAFSPIDSRLLAVGYGGVANVSHVVLWDLDAGTELARLPGATDIPGFPMDEYAGGVSALAFSPDGKHLVAGFGVKYMLKTNTVHNPLKVWEVATRRLIRHLDGHTGYCVSLAFSNDGKRLASGSRDGTAIVWSAETWKPLVTFENPDRTTDPNQNQGGRHFIEDVAFSPDNATLALASRGGNIHLFDVIGGKHLDTLRGHSSAVQAVAFSPNGRTLASGGSDQAIRLWNVMTRRELMQLDRGSTEFGLVTTVAFSPNGQQLLAGGDRAAVWSTAPVLWSDADRAAERLQFLLNSNAEFKNRIRMMSENLRLHEALGKLDPEDARVQAALAATRANWLASRQAWPEAVAAFDRLLAIDPNRPDNWLRTQGLLRVATALLHENRPAHAAALLQGGLFQRASDGLPRIQKTVGFGFLHVEEDDVVRIAEVYTGAPASRSNMRPGDIVVKVNGDEITAANVPNFRTLIEGDAGTKARFTVRHSGSAQTEDIDLVKETYRADSATGELFVPLLNALEKRLEAQPLDPGLLELRAELAGQEYDLESQAANYTAAIEVLSTQKVKDAAAVQRLYRRRGDAYSSLKKWPQAIDDYSRIITPQTTEVPLLANRARAFEAIKNWEAAAADWPRAAAKSPIGAKLLAEFARRLVTAGQFAMAKELFDKSRALYERLIKEAPDSDPLATELSQLLLDHQENENNSRWVVLRPTEMKSQGATLTLLRDGSILASGENPDRDTYTLVAAAGLEKITAIRLEALPDPSLPNNGPGRFPENGNFHLNKLRVFSGGVPVPLTGIVVDHHERPEIQSVIDGPLDISVGWANHPRAGKPNTAVIASRLQRSSNDDLKFELYFSRQYTQHNLGSFRLSVSSDPTIFEREEQRFAAAKVTDPWVKLATAYAMNGQVDMALFYFDRALERADGFESRKPILELASHFDAVLSALVKRRPDDVQRQLALARSLARTGKQQLAAQQLEPARADLERSREIFTRLRAEPRWTVLTPAEMKSTSGAVLEPQKNGSVFVHQRNPTRDSYTLVFQSDLKKIAALRLEVLADPNLPSGGPGWGKEGNFIINKVILQTSTAEAPDKPKPIALKNAAADFSQEGWDIRRAIDNSTGGFGWAVRPEFGKDHVAVFETAGGMDGRPSRLIVRIDQGNPYDTLVLGRFRVSFAEDAATLQVAQIRLDLKDSELTDVHVALAKTHARQGRTEEAAASLTAALGYSDRAGKSRIIAEASSLDGVLEKLAEKATDDAQVQVESARLFAERGKLQPASAARARARALFEAKLAKEPDNPAVAGELADVLLMESTAWTVLKPTEMKCESLAKLRELDDHSILAGGEAPSHDVYTVTFRDLPPRIQTLRLEVLPHDSLPQHGPGRNSNGNYCLTAMKVQLELPMKEGASRELRLMKAAADFSFLKYSKSGPIDADHLDGWGILPEAGKPHAAVLEFAEPVAVPEGAVLRVRLEFKSVYGYHVLGRFRLSACGDPAVFAREGGRFTAIRTADPWTKLAAAYHLAHDQPALERLLKQHPTAAVGIGDVHAGALEWEQAIAVYGKLVADHPADVAVLTKLAAAYQGGGRTREALAVWVKESTINPRDTLLSSKVAVLQAWFGQDREFAATRQRLDAFAKDSNDTTTLSRAVISITIVAGADRAEIESALVLGRKAATLQPNDLVLLARGMAEFRGGDNAAAEETLLTIAKHAPHYPITDIAAFYRAMILLRQGKVEQARTLAMETAVKMKPWPRDEQNPLAVGDADADDLFLWLAYKEAKATIRFDRPGAAPVERAPPPHEKK